MHVYEKNSVILYGHVKNFDCGEIFGGALIFLALKFFLACDLSWNDELNFCVAEPQDSR